MRRRFLGAEGSWRGDGQLGSAGLLRLYGSQGVPGPPVSPGPEPGLGGGAFPSWIKTDPDLLAASSPPPRVLGKSRSRRGGLGAGSHPPRTHAPRLSRQVHRSPKRLRQRDRPGHRAGSGTSPHDPTASSYLGAVLLPTPAPYPFLSSAGFLPAWGHPSSVGTQAPGGRGPPALLTPAPWGTRCSTCVCVCFFF